MDNGISNDVEARVRTLIREAKGQVADADRSSSTGTGLFTKPWSEYGPPPDLIPGYELSREIHRGGQGVVYEAVQRSTRRRVAVKVMREGPFAGAGDRLRFEREVRILAQLSHPHIVAVHDCNHAAGHDYFVMDFVEGLPLDEFLEQSSDRRDVRNVVALFIKVCEGINAAHLRGVIHRDLKPGNVLVDSTGEPRILDFGLAKQSDLAASRTPTMTITGQFVGSLPWSSPEQVRGDEVDLRTDVYSLGVMLYHALTGRFPYALTNKTADMLDAIRHQTPVRPTYLRNSIDADLEAVVLKCLAKEPDRRYQIAGELAADLRRYLEGRPIDARRESTLYVLRKTLRRYRAATLTTLGVIGLTVAFGVVTALQSAKIAKERDRAETQRLRAERAQQFLQSLFASVAPEGVPADDVTLRSVLDDGARRVESEFREFPEEAAAIHETLGRTYDKLGYFTEGEAQWRQSLEWRRSAFGPEHPMAVRTLGRLALVVFNKQDLDAAEGLFREAIRLGEKVLGTDEPEVLNWRNELASLLAQQKRYDEAESIVRETAAIGEPLLGEDHRVVFVARWVLARCLNGQGHPREAIQILDRIDGNLAPPNRIEGAAAEATLLIRAEACENLGDIQGTEAALRLMIDSRRKRLGDHHPALAWGYHFLARILLQYHDDASAAEPLIRQALEIQLERKGPNHLDTADCRHLLARVLMRRGEMDEAAEQLQETIRIRSPYPSLEKELADARTNLDQCQRSAVHDQRTP